MIILPAILNVLCTISYPKTASLTVPEFISCSKCQRRRTCGNYLSLIKTERKNPTMHPVLQRVFSSGPPVIVAELSGNHQQDIKLARDMILAAAEAGADAIKLQTYTADTMTLPMSTEQFMINEESSLWYGQSLHELYQKASTPWEWHKELFDLACDLGMMAFSSPFDASAVTFLEELGVPCYKIASFELVDLPLIKLVAATGKPVIMSTGMASLQEIEEAVKAAKEAGASDIALLKCTSTYPAPTAETNLRTIPDMRKRLGCPVGLSDHTIGNAAAIASVALGGCLIEKHFTLDRSAGGVDSAFSIEPEELRNLVVEAEEVYLALGDVHYGGTESEENGKMHRRSIYIKNDLKAGHRLSKSDLAVIRPGFGLAPKYFDEILGRQLKVKVSAGTPLEWSFLVVDE